METNQTQLLARLHEIYLVTTVESTVNPGHRNIRELWHEEWKPILKEQRELRDQIRQIRVGNSAYIQTRIGYAVAGWSESHSYFRNRYAIYDTLEEAKSCVQALKSETKWGIPTVIVKMTYRLSESPAPESFETAPIDQLGFADSQEIVTKDKMGSRGPSWDLMLYHTGKG